MTDQAIQAFAAIEQDYRSTIEIIGRGSIFTPWFIDFVQDLGRDVYHIPQEDIDEYLDSINWF